jgi:hypothetical protein
MAGDTSRTRKTPWRVLGAATALAVAILLTACQKDSGTATAPSSVPQPKPKQAAPAKKGPTVAELTAGMVEAAGQGKGSAPVDLKFELTRRPKVGQILEINLALIAQIDANPASIQVSGADGLGLDPGAEQFDIPMVEAGEVYRHTVKVTPNADGLFLMGVTIVLKHDETIDSRAFSIPIIADR